MFAQAPFLAPQLLRNSKNAATALCRQLLLRIRRCPPVRPWKIRQRYHGACGSWDARAGAVSYHLISLPPRRLRELCARAGAVFCLTCPPETQINQPLGHTHEARSQTTPVGVTCQTPDMGLKPVSRVRSPLDVVRGHYSSYLYISFI